MLDTGEYLKQSKLSFSSFDYVGKRSECFLISTTQQQKKIVNISQTKQHRHLHVHIKTHTHTHLKFKEKKWEKEIIMIMN